MHRWIAFVLLVLSACATTDPADPAPSGTPMPGIEPMGPRTMLVVATEDDVPTIIYRAEPDRLRVERHFAERLVVEGWSGGVAWRDDGTRVAILTGSEAEEVREEAFGPWFAEHCGRAILSIELDVDIVPEAFQPPAATEPRS